jgi:hypothetical protein
MKKFVFVLSFLGFLSSTARAEVAKLLTCDRHSAFYDFELQVYEDRIEWKEGSEVLTFYPEQPLTLETIFTSETFAVSEEDFGILLRVSVRERPVVGEVLETGFSIAYWGRMKSYTTVCFRV